MKALSPITRGAVFVALAATVSCQLSSPAPVGPPPPKPPPELPMDDPSGTATKLTYPDNRRGDAVDVLHGVEVADPYRWLEEEKAPAVTEWLDAQDKLARGQLEALPERQAIADRLKQLFYVDSLSAPVHRGDRYFYRRSHADKEKAIIYWKEGKKGEEKVLFDPNGWSDDGSVVLKNYSVSWDGTNVAYTVSENNSDEATMYVKDVATGTKSKVDVIEGAKYAYPSWTPKGDGFYYTWLPKEGSVPPKERPGFAEIRFHKLGADPATDVIVRQKSGDPTKFLSADISRDGRWLLLSVFHGWSSTDVYFKDLNKGHGSAFVPLAVGSDNHFYTEAHDGHFYIRTNEGAERWRLMKADPQKPDRKNWKEIVAEAPNATLDGFSILGGKLALTYMKNAASALEIRDLDGKPIKAVTLPSIGSIEGPVGRSDEDEAYFRFESFTTPAEIYELSMKDQSTSLYSKVDVPVDTSPYQTTQVFYPSKDGTRVSMFVVHRKDLVKDGNNRVLLYGYGGFQSSQTPQFVSSVYAWLERGGVYAVPNLRGGAEYGEAWHKDGMLLKKQNVFDDFIGAAEFLVREKYTRPGRLVINGGSNGGLLVGAAMTQRPDLYGAVICAVPLLDMVRYHLFGSGQTWISEYGSADDPAQFQALYAYSPYHHVKAGTAYPPLLMLSADSDDRVDPMHARKFSAAVQDATTGGPVLVRVERNSGHAGADMRKAEVQKGADRYAFALYYTRDTAQ